MGLKGFVVRRLLYPLDCWRKGDLGVLRWLREFERTQYLSPDELRDLQLRRLRVLLAHAYDNCPFYRERFDAVGMYPEDVRTLEDLRHLPVLEKSDLQSQGERLVARDWPKDDLIPNQTGGSTGTPVTFFGHNERRRSRTAATLRHNRWAGWNVGDRSAVLWGAASDKPRDDWRVRLRRAMFGEPLWLDAGHVTEEKLTAFHRELLRFRPHALLTYARAGVLFARFLEQRGWQPHRPRGIVTSAEVLEADERDLLQRAFGCPVFNRYGCREMSVLASECPAHQGMHVMAEGVYLEIDRGGKPARPGEMGSILATDLLNFAMPLIRYRVGDVGAWADGACPCGRGLPRLERIEGRITDFLVGGDGRLVSGLLLATYIVGPRPSLGQVQIRQDRPGKVVYRIRPGHDFSPSDDLPYLEGGTREYLGENTVVGWEIVDELPAEPSGKFLFSKSSVAPEFLCGARRG